MEIKFEVHNVAPSEERRIVKVEGEDTPAIIPVLEVELVTTDDAHGSLTLRFRGQAAKDAIATFPVGSVVAMTVGTPVKAAAKAA